MIKNAAKSSLNGKFIENWPQQNAQRTFGLVCLELYSPKFVALCWEFAKRINFERCKQRFPQILFEQLQILTHTEVVWQSFNSWIDPILRRLRSSKPAQQSHFYNTKAYEEMGKREWTKKKMRKIFTEWRKQEESGASNFSFS